MLYRPRRAFAIFGAAVAVLVSPAGVPVHLGVPRQPTAPLTAAPVRPAPLAAAPVEAFTIDRRGSDVDPQPGTPHSGITPSSALPRVAATGSSGPGYQLWDMGSDVARWEPCTPIDYVINVSVGPANAAGEIHEAIRRVSLASGLQFRFLGTTTGVPQRNYGQDWSPANLRPLTIAYAGSENTDLLRGDSPGAIGEGGFAMASWSDASFRHPLQIVSGMVVLDARVNLAAGFNGSNDGGSTSGRLLMHEIGHAVGLRHTTDASQVMYPVIDGSAANFGTGDRAGLVRLGSASGCNRVSTAPYGYLESAVWNHGTDGASPTVSLTGWGLDPKSSSSSIDVHAYVNGHLAAVTTARGARADVNNTMGVTGAHGYTVTVPATAGRNTVCVYAIDPAGRGNPLLGCRDTADAPPIGTVDTLRWVPSLTGGSVEIRGWTVDRDTPSASTDVHVYVDGARTIASTGADRPDVNAAIGVGGRHGFSVGIPTGAGSHQVCTYAIDTDGGDNSALGCRTVAGSAAPLGALTTSPHGR